MSKKPALFISFASQEQEWVDLFRTALRQYGFNEVSEDEYQDSNTRAQAIQAQDILLLLLTPELWDAKHVREDVRVAVLAGLRIVPLLFKPTHAEGFIRYLPWIKIMGLAIDAAARRVIDAPAFTMPLAARNTIAVSSPLNASEHQAIVPPNLVLLGFCGYATQTEEVIIPPLRRVAAGMFTMGAQKRHDAQAGKNEGPQHLVDLAAFAISTFPVTVAEYACAVKTQHVPEPEATLVHTREGPPRPLTWHDQLAQSDHPVVLVSWVNAMKYADWLSHVTGETWRLPTEAEWEKAARGTDGRIYPWGNTWDQGRANTMEGKKSGTTAIGTYPTGASPYGVQDLAGNVSEWCLSKYEPYPYDAEDGREDVAVPRLVSEERILRGGNFNLGFPYARTSARWYNVPLFYSFVVGLRLVRSSSILP